MTIAADEIKSCCAAAYSSVAARFLLGESFHPGGAPLTSRLIAALGVGPGGTVVDVACGPGASTVQLAREAGCEAVGIDLAVPDRTSHPRVRFVRGDAEALPLDDESVDGALCECALCTFPNKEQAARELARVLRPGARLALSDVTAEPGRMPAELTTVDAWVACVADARPLEEIATLLDRAGLTVERTESHDGALVRLLEHAETRLRAVRVLGAFDVDCALELCAAARKAVLGGILGYCVVIARR